MWTPSTTGNLSTGGRPPKTGGRLFSGDNFFMSASYYQVAPAQCEGRGWNDSESPFGRLPLTAQTTLPTVWPFSHTSTGECCFFNSDATDIFIREELGESMLGEPTFNVCAYSGVDLYCFDETQNRWRWASTTPYHGIENQHPEYALIEKMTRRMRRFRLYLPLRNRLLK